MEKRTRKPLTEEQRKRQIAYNDEYIKSTLDVFHVKAQKSKDIPARIEQAVQSGIAPSKQAYIIQAIEDKLSKDGY